MLRVNKQSTHRDGSSRWFDLMAIYKIWWGIRSKRLVLVSGRYLSLVKTTIETILTTNNGVIFVKLKILTTKQ